MLPPYPNASEDRLVLEEVEHATASRVYLVSIPDEHVTALTSERLAGMAKSVRLPGFRPGRIPVTVILSRYGAKARGEILRRLAGKAADQVLERSELAASMELAEGADSGNVRFRLSVTHLPELPPVDFAALKLERLRAPQSALAPHGLNAESAREMFEESLRRQVLDFLNEAYRFPLAPVLIDREYALIRQAADEMLAGNSATQAGRDAMAEELMGIAERRVRLGAVIVEMARRYEIRVSAAEAEHGKGSGETAEQAARRIQEDKVIAWFLSRAQVTEREATDEELRELIDSI